MGNLHISEENKIIQKRYFIQNKEISSINNNILQHVPIESEEAIIVGLVNEAKYGDSKSTDKFTSKLKEKENNALRFEPGTMVEFEAKSQIIKGEIFELIDESEKIENINS